MGIPKMMAKMSKDMKAEVENFEKESAKEEPPANAGYTGRGLINFEVKIAAKGEEYKVFYFNGQPINDILMLFYDQDVDIMIKHPDLEN